MAILAVAFANGARGQVSEYQIKAAFLYNFAGFVEWPANSFTSPSDPIVICILGANHFGDALEEDTRGKVLAGRTFAVRMVIDAPPKSSCHILFVNSSDRKRFQAMVASLEGNGVLTVGDAPWFIADGGIINFKVQGGKVRFEINVVAAKQAHLRISSKLLSLAELSGSRSLQ
ncbi:MAG: YfiR family protein [Candidatus Acidiferrum sp.]